GTVRVGEAFTKAGFITLAPDFLGYGESDNPSINVMEERFQTYTTALTLLSSIKNLPNANPDKIGIWGHSNGGQIALSILAITGKNYPTVLWAPVSKPFPYSILYYTDEFEDHGKLLRKVVADFEKDYDIELYSPPNYYEWINAPIQIHQGGADDAAPQKWSDQLVKTLKELEKEVEYFTYAGDDHNFAKGSWQIVVDRNINFFRNYLTN
ncbi:dienelactone hydrolase family protein, partial [Candidatus Gottesmanbacteria bacterium]|nr:dienelactone hydrolase family protein [Candidatus Gottesmanbacteria bacterium]